MKVDLSEGNGSDARREPEAQVEAVPGDPFF